MGQVISIGKNQRGVLNHIVETIDATDLRKVQDFEIASIVVVDGDATPHSLGGFLKQTSNVLFRENNGKFIDIAQKLVKNETVFETQYPSEEVRGVKFYRMSEQVDIDLATELGLGVVYFDNAYLLYSPFMDNDPTLIVFELMMLKVYAQLRSPEDIDINLRSNFDKVEDMITSYIFADAPKHMNRLKEIYGF